MIKLVWCLVLASVLSVDHALGGSVNNNNNEVDSKFNQLVAGVAKRRQGQNGRMMRSNKNQKTARNVAGGLRKRAEQKVPSFMQTGRLDQTIVREEDIINGSWLLYNIKFKETVHSEPGGDYKDQVYGIFCKIDMSQQKEDPSKGMSSRLLVSDIL